MNYKKIKLTNPITLIQGDCLNVLPTLPAQSVNCCVTSPPYWGLRDYGVSDQIGLESTPEAYVSKMVAVFREVRRALRDDGTLWLNLGDSYAGYHGNNNCEYNNAPSNKNGYFENQRCTTVGVSSLKQKDLVGIPWRVAFALQADGWWLRQDIIWHKPNPMPESVKDRCTKAHEYIFLLTKSARYYYDADAIAEESPTPNKFNGSKALKSGANGDRNDGGRGGIEGDGSRNKRSVWTVTTKPYSGAHFATFPPDLIEPCILAGCPVGGTVLDPFNGSGTTGMVSIKHNRNYIGIELNPEYIALSHKRIEGTQRMLVME